jgi:hypothetical protein
MAKMKVMTPRQTLRTILLPLVAPPLPRAPPPPLPVLTSDDSDTLLELRCGCWCCCWNAADGSMMPCRSSCSSLPDLACSSRRR